MKAGEESLITEVLKISGLDDVNLMGFLYYFRSPLAQWLGYYAATLEIRGSPPDLSKIHSSCFHPFEVDKISTKHAWKTRDWGLCVMLTTGTYTILMTYGQESGIKHHRP